MKYFTLVKAYIVCPLDIQTSAVTYVLLRKIYECKNTAYMQSSYSKPKNIQPPSSSLFMLFQSPSILFRVLLLNDTVVYLRLN